MRKQTEGETVWNTPIVPARYREQAETAIPSDEKTPDNGNLTRMVRDKVYIDNNVHTPKVLEFSKLLSDIHCPISIFIDHVKQY
jgi:hypothetical protein